MKKIILIALLAITTTVWSQSKSYQALKEHFIDQPDVHAFTLRGFICRAVLSIADDGQDQDVTLLRKAMADINHVRFITIPKAEFAIQGLSVDGFRSYLHKDKYEVLAEVRDKGEKVTFYQRDANGNKSSYFVLIEESTEVVAIEMKGYIDPKIFEEEQVKVAMYNK